MEVRRAGNRDEEAVADLIVRTKRLNNEFDPLFSVVEDAAQRALSYVQASLRNPAVLLMVASEGGKVTGVLRGEIRDRLFYEPSREGFITDFYILPKYRRRALGHSMLDKATQELRRMGAQIIVAEVPTRNEIAHSFYSKRGFRSIVQHYGLDRQ